MRHDATAEARLRWPRVRQRRRKIRARIQAKNANWRIVSVMEMERTVDGPRRRLLFSDGSTMDIVTSEMLIRANRDPQLARAANEINVLKKAGIPEDEIQRALRVEFHGEG